MRHPRQRLAVGLVLSMFVALGTAGATTGCSRADRSETSGPAQRNPAAGVPKPANLDAATGATVAPTGGQPQAQGGSGPGGSAPALSGPAGSGSASPAPTNGAAGRSIVYTGTVTFRLSATTDLDTVAAKINTLATGVEGFTGTDERSLNGRESQATLTLRVPSARFAEFLAGLHGLGIREESRSFKTEDVTTQVVDLNARIATARASIDRVRDLMSRAQTISDVVSLEGELSRREADLESLEARLRKLNDLTNLSTVTVVLLGADAHVRDEPRSGFLGRLADAWDAFTGSVAVLVIIAAALLPWLVPLGLVSFLVVRRVRRNRRRRPAPHGYRAPSPNLAPPQYPAQAAPTPTTGSDPAPQGPHATPQGPGAASPTPGPAPQSPGAPESGPQSSGPAAHETDTPDGK